MFKKLILIVCFILCHVLISSLVNSLITKEEKLELKLKVLEMFDHAFDSYMRYGYPADEIMPLSCKGRYRNSEASRGDIDEVLGNYTLTLVDSLDTLALLGRLDEFERAVKNVMQIHFDRDLIVSVFESNIRMLGGLISGHVSLIYLKNNHYPNRFKWYKNELLLKAKDLGLRLLPAFNTTTGLPMSRINLKYGITESLLSSEKDKFTCTACAGTLLLEFAVLSRLTGDKTFEEKATKTLDYIWDKRNRASNLVGTVINVNDGEWSVKDSSIGAGIDSYYEYLFKVYF
jgi:mannosidase alpha-like ER degradation enhancer 3